jgi:hypothetical protein
MARGGVMTIISLHLPRTAGTSFKASLVAHFGEHFREDNNDQAISQPVHQRCKAALSAGMAIAEQGLDEVKCVHGHFLPVKYLLHGTRRDLTFVTWMRDPMARLISHYYYWQESYDEKTAAPHHRQVIEERWTLEQFCLSEKFRNIYTQYLWGFPLENFAYIGISEHYREDMREFSERFLSVNLTPQHHNATAYRHTRPHLDETFLDKVRDFHAADMKLYLRALQWRQARLHCDRKLSSRSMQNHAVRTVAVRTF